MDVWRANPIFGAGLKNFGVYASTLYQEGELAGMFANPMALYDYVLHNLYMTTLSEMGIAGCIALLWIFIDFFRRNAQLRSPLAEQRWHELGGQMKLRPIALGLEGRPMRKACKSESSAFGVTAGVPTLRALAKSKCQLDGYW